jgi:hypothetical protein
MKHVNELTDQELELEIAKKSGEYSEGYFDKNPQNVPSYTSDWKVLMPLAVNYGINFHQTTALGIRTGNMYAQDILGEFETMCCENPQRAIAECLLLVMRKK